MALSDLPPLIDILGTDPNKYETEPNNHYQKLMRKNSDVVRNHIAASHSEKVKHIISLVPDGGNYKDLPDEYKNSRNFHVAWTRFKSDNPAPTIDTGHRHHFHINTIVFQRLENVLGFNLFQMILFFKEIRRSNSDRLEMLFRLYWHRPLQKHYLNI